MTAITFNVTQFRTQFSPAFDNTTQYPDAQLQLFWNNANSFIYNNPNTTNAPCFWFPRLSTIDLTLALNLMTAHLTQLWTLLQQGITPQVITSSTIDKITVTLLPPPVKNQFSWWLQTTPYGMELYALLMVNSVGGFYIGGSPVLSSFPRPGTYWY